MPIADLIELRERVAASIAKWLRREADYARHAQDGAKDAHDKLYRMGQKDALLLAADAIERGPLLTALIETAE